MSFDSIFFISCFLPVVLALYFLVPNVRFKNAVLLIVGLVFYSFGSFSGLGILCLFVAANILLLFVLKRCRFKKLTVTVGVVLDLLTLGFFKYLNFFVCDILGLEAVELSVVAPLGISFLVFKCISLIIDAYRDPESVELRVDKVLLYISFFPQVTAGPIARYGQFASQLESRTTDLEIVTLGLRRFVVGLSKKVIICGAVGKIADEVFGMSNGLDARAAWLGAVAYMLQIYFDFSGYSDMAIGLGNVFGFRTLENFNYPYVANSVGNFWRRWHISLSSWFKDYLYIPLGGNRKGVLRTALNKVIVFTLCGFWHGANWTFMVWGFWHGLFTGIESLLTKTVKKLNSNRIGNVFMHVYTLLVVALGFAMFRADSLANGLSVIAAMFTGFEFSVESTVLLHKLLNPQSVLMLVLAAVLSMPVKKIFDGKGRVTVQLSLAGTLLLFALCVLSLASGGFAPFIYAQF